MARLTVIKGEQIGREYLLREEFTIGKDPECDLVLTNRNVSSRHARLTRGSRGWAIEHLSGLGATLLNGKVIDKAALANGNKITIGGTCLAFSTADGAYANPCRVPAGLPGREGTHASRGGPAPPAADELRSRAPGSSVRFVIEADGQSVRTLLSHAAKDPAAADRTAELIEQIHHALSQAGHIGQLVELLTSGIPQVFKCRACRVFVKDPGKKAVVEGRGVLPVETDTQPGFSATAVEKTLRERRALCCQVQSHADLRASESIRRLDLKWFACAPIHNKGGELVGVIYLDSLEAAEELGPDDLERLCAIGTAAGHYFDATERLTRYVEHIRATEPPPDVIAKSPQMQAALEQVHRVARFEHMHVLFTGESGTGKEVLAQRLHAHSPRAYEPLVVVNCGALGEGLVYSELLGHEKGSFTSAHERRTGLIEQADCGTLFLDEIGDLPLSGQTAILHATEGGKFRRVGGADDLSVNVRVIAATNRDLRAMVAQGTFRHDLYRRIAQAHIELSPLRERPDDIVPLAEHFLAEFTASNLLPCRAFTPEAQDVLRAYEWPGNARQLRTAVQLAAAAAHDHEAIGCEHLPAWAMPEEARVSAQQGRLRAAVDETERRLIDEALRAHRGNKTHAAAWLGIKRDTLNSKIKKHGLDKVGQS